MINLSKVYIKHAKLFSEYFIHQIQKGKDFDNKKKYSVLSPSTLESQKGRKPDTRLRKSQYTSGQFSTMGFTGKATRNGFKIEPRTSRDATIFQYNDSTGDSAHIKDPPTLLPTTDIEVETLPVFKAFMTDIATELLIQANGDLAKLNKTIEIRI